MKKHPDQLELTFEPIAAPARRVIANLGRRLHSERYRHHMASDQWRATRQRLIGRAGKRCHRCGARVNLQLHHLHYKTLGEERDHDLEVLCKWCHEKADEQRRMWSEIP